MPAPVYADRVKETTTTTGTGALTLAGAFANHRPWSVIGDQGQAYYAIEDQTSTDFEEGFGTYTLSGTSLSRDQVLVSSNSNNLVSFGAGTKTVTLIVPGKVIQLMTLPLMSALG